MTRWQCVEAYVLAMALVGALAVAARVTTHAQAAVPTFVTAQVFRAGEALTGLPFMEFTWRWEPEIYCNLVTKPVVPGVVFNPTTIQFTDPDSAHPDRSCRINWGTYLQTLPVATGYRLTITYLFADGPPSARGTVSGQFRRGPLGTFCLDRGGVAIETSQAVPNSTEAIRIMACVETQ
jgi:hypothetical protein